MASVSSAVSGASSSSEKMRSAAARVDWRSPMILANSLMGPENFREYSTKDEMCPTVREPPRYKRAPNTLINVSERLFTKLMQEPTMFP